MRAGVLTRLVTAALLAAVAVGCAGDDGTGDQTGTTTTRATTPPVTSPPFVPVPGGTDEEGDPQPPPVHAVFSVVVVGDAGWSPYASRELTGLDTEAAAAIGRRLRQVDQVLTGAGITASIELAYGPAAALCAVDPDVLDLLESHDHVIGMHARTNGESFRAVHALAACGRTPVTASGLASMAEPVGPRPTTAESLVDAMAVLDVHGIDQVLGSVSPMCESLGLAGHTNEYGTGAFTAPWRSAWADGNPCADSPAGRIVVVDQVRLAPGDGDDRVSSQSLSTVDSRLTQTMGWAADQRYKLPEELPVPGMLTWGVTVRLDDLLASATESEPGDDDGDSDEDAGDEQPEPVVLDPRTDPLAEATLTALAELLAEWQPSAESGRLRWMTPEAVALILRPR